METLIITGGSSGIGAAVARLAAVRGCAMAISYSNDDAAAYAIVAEVGSLGGNAIAVKGDVSQERDVIELFATATRELGSITALVNNAGITGPLLRLDEMDVATIERVLAVNVTGSLLCAREAVRRMSTRHGGAGGSIVNLSSVASRLGSGGEFIHYAVSKGAIDTLTIGLAREVATASAVKMYVCNVMTQPGETDSLTASEHVAALLANAGERVCDYVIVNDQLPSRLLNAYAEEGQTPVIPDADRIKAMGLQPVRAQVISETINVRHDPSRLAHVVLGIIDRAVAQRASYVKTGPDRDANAIA